MNLLAVDSATKSLGTAVLNDDMVIAEIYHDSNETHSKHLLTNIERTLEISGIDRSELNGLVVTIGPGSFTGLRIGLSIIKGMAFALDIPVVGVSSLEILASQVCPTPYVICPVLDARKGEVYYSFYRYEKGKLKQIKDEQVDSPGNMLGQISEPSIFIGNGATIYGELIKDKLREKAFFAPGPLNTIKASNLAIAGLDKFKNCDSDELDGLTPKYLRKSDAELNFIKK